MCVSQGVQSRSASFCFCNLLASCTQRRYRIKISKFVSTWRFQTHANGALKHALNFSGFCCRCLFRAQTAGSAHAHTHTWKQYTHQPRRDLDLLNHAWTVLLRPLLLRGLLQAILCLSHIGGWSKDVQTNRKRRKTDTRTEKATSRQTDRRKDLLSLLSMCMLRVCVCVCVCACVCVYCWFS